MACVVTTTKTRLNWSWKCNSLATTITRYFSSDIQDMGFVKDQMCIPLFPALILELRSKICTAINLTDGNIEITDLVMGHLQSNERNPHQTFVMMI
ncbi:hypothetical protein TNCV_860121 [Trichonephila clavipes]|nr:hypothetical protein TNCV_860121 [Trichonephila clavipes]